MLGIYLNIGGPYTLLALGGLAGADASLAAARHFYRKGKGGKKQ